mmetsp:Transcript_14847/g.32062  ORF Transcript_14847/g.32062 Transcript_14847/m.32062 type:complete len:114 (-) Transcript_14847:260-601(-)
MRPPRRVPSMEAVSEAAAVGAAGLQQQRRQQPQPRHRRRDRRREDPQQEADLSATSELGCPAKPCRQVSLFLSHTFWEYNNGHLGPFEGSEKRLSPIISKCAAATSELSFWKV